MTPTIGGDLRMQHVLRFEGGYERNFSALRPGGGEYDSDDGARQHAVPWPAEADGIRFGFMEQRGKRFLAVRVEYADAEVLLRHPVRLDPTRHLGGRRFSAKPIPLADESASALLGDMVDLNPELRSELHAVRERVRRDLSMKPAGSSG
jgi:hypothetical protein